MNFAYKGGIAFLAHFDTVFGFPIRISCRLKHLDGRMLLIFQDNGAYHYGFIDTPSHPLRFSFEVKASFGFIKDQWVKIRLLDWFLSSVFMHRVFRSRFVVPSIRSKWWLVPPVDQTDR
jgi:hypothetical protein